jgi:hypothetical protein
MLMDPSQQKMNLELQMSQHRVELLERTPEIKDQFQQQVDNERESAYRQRVHDVA